MTIYGSVINKIGNISQFMCKFYLIGFVIPVVYATIPLFFHQYGFQGQNDICWIQIHTEGKSTYFWNIFWVFLMLYLPLWLVWIFNTIVIGKVLLYLKKNFKDNDSLKEITKMKYFPYVLFISWIFGSIDYIA